MPGISAKSRRVQKKNGDSRSGLWITPGLRPLAVPINCLKPDPGNARRHPEYNLDTIRRSLERFGQQKPVVCDRARVVRAGNGTLEAAKQLGHTHIAAVISDLTEAEIAAYALADNRTGELSEWDEAKLAAALGALPEDLQLAAGWKADEVRDAMANGRGEIVEDEPPAPKPKATTKLGDLWLLGPHRLLCGDSTKAEDVDRLMNGERANLVATDPPYLVDYTGKRAGGQGKDWSETYREVDIVDAEKFFAGVFANMVRIVAPHAAIYCWHAHKRQALIAATWAKLGILDHQQIIWVKPAAVFGSVMYHFRHEPCMLGWVQGSKPPHDGDHATNSVWTTKGRALEQFTREELLEAIKSASTVWEIDWEGKSRAVDAEHPTQKPVEIFARPMRKHTRADAVCYEPFSGSGTQLSAAEQLGRRCFAMELEPVFVEVAVRRWQRLTGKKAKRVGADGKTKAGLE